MKFIEELLWQKLYKCFGTYNVICHIPADIISLTNKLHKFHSETSLWTQFNSHGAQ